MDAVLGAAALGDIGQHFPDNDPAYAGADSLELARHVARILSEHGYRVENIDATILCQRLSWPRTSRPCGPIWRRPSACRWTP